MSPPPAIRPATPADAEAIRLLHRASLWGLGPFAYSLREIDSIVRHVQTLDPELLASGRYYVAELGGELAGTGGWSDDTQLHPSMRPANANGLFSITPSAKMRAIFVSPKFARMGVGRAILAHTEGEACAAGFAKAELLATLSGVRLGERAGYASLGRVRLPLADGTLIDLVHMKKPLLRQPAMRAA
jgi:GNAT superfamily N-acetyltransferase